MVEHDLFHDPLGGLKQWIFIRNGTVNTMRNQRPSNSGSISSGDRNAHVTLSDGAVQKMAERLKIQKKDIRSYICFKIPFEQVDGIHRPA